ncbi:MAG: 6,7-dimethyl-8-ribityllumazine synthase [Sphingomonadales bacterium]|nr:6,7-dimethyl-8-ribityllumazine synthase [Sphingomonadales bacterium]
MSGSSGIGGRRELSFTAQQLSTLKLGLVKAEWNSEITDELAAGARRVWLEHGFTGEQLIEMVVPGSFELPLGARWLIEDKGVDAVVALGCLIKGETPHFEYISQAVSTGLMQVGLSTGVPVAFGVLTVLTEAQARDRVGGSIGHKGVEATETVLRMLAQKLY